jgi:hypothetical protein
MSSVVVFATCKDRPLITADDALAAQAVQASGDTDVVAIPWDADANWEQFDAVIIRSTWDYFRRIGEYREWLEDLNANGGHLLNPPAVAQWNAHKSYLRELAAQDVAIVPTFWFDKDAEVGIKEVLQSGGWDKAVIKPTVSCTAYETWITSTEELTNQAHRQRLTELLRGGAVMVQPFMNEITSKGEWSLILFNGTYSHAVIKRPKRGDFRVQAQFGGTWEVAHPSDDLVRQAEHVLAVAANLTATEHALYARVDGLESDKDGRFLLMELELIEPVLFFGADPASAPRRFANALQQRMQILTRARQDCSQSCGGTQITANYSPVV